MNDSLQSDVAIADAIFHRRSIRKYCARKVEPEVVQKLLMAAVQAPSAMNQQPWVFAVFPVVVGYPAEQPCPTPRDDPKIVSWLWDSDRSTESKLEVLTDQCEFSRLRVTKGAADITPPIHFTEGNEGNKGAHTQPIHDTVYRWP